MDRNLWLIYMLIIQLANKYVILILFLLGTPYKYFCARGNYWIISTMNHAIYMPFYLSLSSETRCKQEKKHSIKSSISPEIFEELIFSSVTWFLWKFFNVDERLSINVWFEETCSTSNHDFDDLQIMATEVARFPQLEVLNRVLGLPVIELALAKSAQTYNRVKDCHQFVHWALSTAEASISTATRQAVPIAAPIAKKLENPIQFVDHTLCRGLDKIEEKMPLVKEKPELVG